MKSIYRRLVAVVFFVLIFTSMSSAEQTLVLFDDFSGSLTENWTPGRAGNLGSGHSLAIVDGRLEWDQQFDFIESKATFGNDIMVEFDYAGLNGSFQLADIWVEFVALTDSARYTAGIYRSQYGAHNYDSINIGRAPSTIDYTVAERVTDPPYLKEIANTSPRQGKIRFVCADKRVQIRFENESAQVINSAWVPTGEFSQTKIRIWGMGGSGSQRYIDNVKIYAPSGTIQTSICIPKVVVIPLGD